MKKRILLAIAALGIALGTSARTLRITLRNLRSDKGVVLLYASGDTKPHFACVAPAEGRAELTIEGISSDSLSVNIFHDENDNRKLDKRADGRPAEGCLRTTVATANEENATEAELRYDFTPAE